MQLHVHMGGRAIPNSPVAVELQPGPVCLSMTEAIGANCACYAGVEQELRIRAADANNNPTKVEDSSKFTVQITSKSQSFKGKTSKHCIMPHSRVQWLWFGGDDAKHSQAMQNPSIWLYAHYFIQVGLMDVNTRSYPDLCGTSTVLGCTSDKSHKSHRQVLQYIAVLHYAMYALAHLT